MKLLRSLAFTAIAAAFAGACGGAPRPEAQIATSEGAIRGATEAGAGNVPTATLHLRLAQEQREAALVAVKDGDNERASFLLSRSEADAELAIALAKQANAEKDAARANEKVQDLQKQVNQ